MSPHIPPTTFVDRPLVYVAGPYTRPDPAANVHRAVSVASELVDGGLVTPIVPHLTMLWNVIAPRDVEFWYAYDLAVLARCDAVLVLPGESVGVVEELAFAQKTAIPIFEDIESLYRWAARPRRGAALLGRDAGPPHRSA